MHDLALKHKVQDQRAITVRNALCKISWEFLPKVTGRLLSHKVKHCKLLPSLLFPALDWLWFEYCPQSFMCWKVDPYVINGSKPLREGALWRVTRSCGISFEGCQCRSSRLGLILTQLEKCSQPICSAFCRCLFSFCHISVAAIVLYIVLYLASC